ncbi:hypothetical protein D3C78_1420980 [compost metagenome]
MFGLPRMRWAWDVEPLIKAKARQIGNLQGLWDALQAVLKAVSDCTCKAKKWRKGLWLSIPGRVERRVSAA